MLLDLALGAEDGLEMLPQLREEPRLSGVRIVAFSNHDSRRREALERGSRRFSQAPFYLC